MKSLMPSIPSYHFLSFPSLPIFSIVHLVSLLLYFLPFDIHSHFVSTGTPLDKQSKTIFKEDFTILIFITKLWIWPLPQVPSLLNQNQQAGINITGRNIKQLRNAGDTTLIAESKEELKSPLMKVKEESEKAGLKLIIQKTKITASSPITFMANRWGNNGNSGKFYFLGLQNHFRR